MAKCQSVCKLQSQCAHLVCHCKHVSKTKELERAGTVKTNQRVKNQINVAIQYVYIVFLAHVCMNISHPLSCLVLADHQYVSVTVRYDETGLLLG